MSDYADIYDHLAEATGTTPGQRLNDDLERLHDRHPAAFAAQAHDVIAAWQAGRVTSPWAFLRKAMQRLDQHRPTSERKAPERQEAIRLSETWIRNAGLYAPLDEAQRELFGERGHLHPWADDEALRIQIAELWRDQQPHAESAEADRIARAERWKEAQRRLHSETEPVADPG